MSAEDRRKKRIERFKMQLDDALFAVESVVGLAEGLNQTNEQYYLDFEDRLNELSCKEHPNKEL